MNGCDPVTRANSEGAELLMHPAAPGSLLILIKEVLGWPSSRCSRISLQTNYRASDWAVIKGERKEKASIGEEIYPTPLYNFQLLFQLKDNGIESS